MRIEYSGVSVPEQGTSVRIPFVVERVPAGFPSPADDYIENRLDLNSYLIKHPAATFFVRVAGDSMTGAGIHSDDLLIVDRAIEAVGDAVVIAAVNRELTVKRIRRREGRLWLVPENGAYAAVEVTADMDFEVWGVVTAVIHRF